jgi:O-antigen ligase
VSHADSGTDNSYLFILATTGIVGLIVYIGFLRSLFHMSWNVYKEKRSIFAIVFIASLSSVLIDSLFINSLFYPFIIVWLWMLVGLINYS